MNRACAQAISEGIHSYSHVKRLTEKLLADALAAIDHADAQPERELELTQEHPLIRSAGIYADFFARCASAQPSQPAPRKDPCMTLNEIERALRELRLSGIAATLSTRVMEAQSAQQPFLETLAVVLQDELDRRHSRLTERHFKHSRLDERVTLADFDCVSTRSCRARLASSCTRSS